MISAILNGKVGSSTNASASAIRAAVSSSHFSKPSFGKMNFDGGVGLSTNRRSQLPVVIVPILREFGTGIQLAVNAIHQLQQATLGFRVVAVTDLGTFRSIRPYGWAITHVISENQWSSEEKSWLVYVLEELHAVKRDFGSSLLLEIDETGVGSRSWNALLNLANDASWPRPVVPRVVGNQQHYSWRGWMEHFRSGTSSHQVIFSDISWNLTIESVSESSIILIDVNSKAEQAAVDRARSRGWTVVSLKSSGVDYELSDLRLALLSLIDAYSFGNVGLVSGVETTLLEEFPQLVIAQRGAPVHIELAEVYALSSWSAGMNLT